MQRVIFRLKLLIICILLSSCGNPAVSDTPLTDEVLPPPSVTPLPSDTSLPTVIPLETATLTLPSQWFGQMRQDSPCYKGPSWEDYDEVAIVPVGTQVEIQGINRQGKNWLFVKWIGVTMSCWIDIGMVEFTFDSNLFSVIPTALVNESSKCRFGPDELYHNLTFLSAGQEVIILSRSVDTKWFLIDNPPYYEGDCWVAAHLVTYGFDLGYLKIDNGPPPVTPMPIIPTWDRRGGEPTPVSGIVTPTSSARTRCNDGRDNDHDGRTDMADPDCSSPEDNTERPH